MLLSNAFWPDPRVEKEASALGGAGYAVTVLAWDRKGDKTPVLEAKGFTVRRIRTRASMPEGQFFLGLPFFFVKVVLAGLRFDCDIIHCHDFDTLPQGSLIAKLKGKRLVYDAHEHYAMMVASDVSPFVSRLLEGWEGRCVPRADLVIAANEPLMDHLRPHVKGETAVVMNCVDLNIAPAHRRRKVGDKLTLFYGGSLEPGRYVLELIEAVTKDEDCVLRIAGRGRYQAQVEEAARKCDRILFLGYVDQERIMLETATSDAILSLLEPANQNYRIATPVKMLEAMAYGVPVIATKGTLTGETVEREGCGLAIDWSEGAFRAALRVLKDEGRWQDMSRNARRAAEEKYNWAVMKDRLLSSYRNLEAKSH
jgi:glycosyltransferase involved in cell wall biosynthesis